MDAKNAELNAAAAGNEMSEAYVHFLQCSRQWRGFLDAMKQEFTAALPPQELRRLMVRVGRRFAQSHPLQARETLPQLQQEMNRIWSERDWGTVEIAQSDRELTINHQFSPLSAAFGASDAEWSTGYLQGVYQQWFDTAGATGLKVETANQSDQWGSARFRLVAA